MKLARFILACAALLTMTVATAQTQLNTPVTLIRMTRSHSGRGI